MVGASLSFHPQLKMRPLLLFTLFSPFLLANAVLIKRDYFLVVNKDETYSYLYNWFLSQVPTQDEL